MNRFVILVFLIGLVNSSLGQKKVIDINAIREWSYLSYHPKISSDGRFVCYAIEKHSSDSRNLIVKSVHQKDEYTFVNVDGDYAFSDDAKSIYYKRNDSAFIFHLDEKRLEVIAGVKSFATSLSRKRWAAYILNNNPKVLVVRDLFSAQTISFNDVSNFTISPNGRYLLTVSKHSNKNYLAVLDFESLDSTIIWAAVEDKNTSLKIRDFAFHSLGSGLAFVIDTKLGSSLWYWQPNQISATKLFDSETTVDYKNHIIKRLRFTRGGDWINFSLAEPVNVASKVDSVALVDIWSYKEPQLNPEQRRLIDFNKLVAFVGINNNKLTVLDANENIETNPEDVPGDHVVVKGNINVQESWWKLNENQNYYLLSLRNGSKQYFASKTRNVSAFYFTPDKKYLVYWDYSSPSKDFFSYAIESGKKINLTSQFRGAFIDDRDNGIDFNSPAGTVAGWVASDSSLLINDNYDVWRIDPKGVKKAINLSNGYGKLHKTRLRLVYDDATVGLSDTSLLLTGFNEKTKFNGFFRVGLTAMSPVELTFGPHSFYKTESQKPHLFYFDNGIRPLKADSSNIWVVRRQSHNEAPNYFWTTDFKNFLPLSNHYPSKRYNWLTAELVSYKQADGQQLQGILYKPENFDPMKKYPLIFNYYEKLSHRLYEYPSPDFIVGNIDIPSFVSKGYLIFTPDINYSNATKTGQTFGDCANSSIVAAVRALSTLSYVDTTRMGLQGHSFGGAETGAILIRSKLFAAAAEAAGTSDAVSAYLTLIPMVSPVEHFAKQNGNEVGQGRYGATPWERPDLYLKNSTVMHADKIVTPLLIMHNINDNLVQWRQGMELFMALRRLHKKVWMLQYDESSHGVVGRDGVDYTNRLTQFFNHYLKSAPAPIWMTQGIPARLKGVITGYDFDPADNCGKACKVCKTWNERWAKDSVATKQLIEKEEKNQWMGLLDTVKPKTNK